MDNKARADALLKLHYALDALRSGINSTMLTARIIGSKRLEEYLKEQEAKIHKS